MNLGMGGEIFVCILTNYNRTLYVVVTNDLERRMDEQMEGIASLFTRKYRINRLVYYESTVNIDAATDRERQIKGWTRAKKIALIESVNPDWTDLKFDSPAP